MAKREFHLQNEYEYDRTTPVRWIFDHTKRYPLLPLILIITAVVNNYGYSYIRVYIGEAFDLITTPNWTTPELIWPALGALIATIIQAATGLIRNFANEILAQRIERDTRDELYLSLLGKSQTFHGRQRIGDIMARATNDVRSLNGMFSPGMMLIIDGAMGIVAPITLIALIDLRLLLVPSIFLIFFAITVYGYAKELGPVSIYLRSQFGKVNAHLAEAISGIELVKGYAREPFETAEFIKNATGYRDYYIKQGQIQARYLPLLVFSITLGLAFMHSLWLWYQNEITLGTVVTFMGLIGVLRFPTFISIFSFNLVQLGLASAQRILELINSETNLDENKEGISQPITGKISFNNVSFGYSQEQILSNISFTAHSGETVAIVGQTGSGKTTLTRLINRIFDANSGEILIDDINVTDWNLESLRSQISTIEQDIFLFSRTIAENIAFGQTNATHELIEQAAKEAQAHEFIMQFDQGYDTEIGERGVTLSGGQRQRLAIARAFLTNPRILILDDSTSAIDSATEDQIQKAMHRISEQRTTFLITHRLSQIRWADRILLLKEGKIIAQGTHEELLQDSPEYQQLFMRTPPDESNQIVGAL